MRPIFKVLLVVEAIVMALAVYKGLLVQTGESAIDHFSIGMVAAIYTMFLHCLALFYLVGTGREIKRTIQDFSELQQKYVPITQRLKKRAFPAGTYAILAILLVAFAGAYVHSELLRVGGQRMGGTLDPSSPLPVRDVDFWWIHLAIFVPALAVNVWAFVVEVAVIRENVEMIQSINGDMAEIAAGSGGAAGADR